MKVKFRMNVDASWHKPLKILNDDLNTYIDTVWRDIKTNMVYKIDGLATIEKILHFTAVNVATNKQCFLHADWLFLHCYERVDNETFEHIRGSKGNPSS